MFHKRWTHMLFEHRYILYISQSAKHIHGYVTDSVHHWKVQIKQAADSDRSEKTSFLNQGV